MKRLCLLYLLSILSITSFAKDIDTLLIAQDSAVEEKKHGSFLHSASKFFDKLFYVDTTYIEPQHYHFQATLYNTLYYEKYHVADNNGNSINIDPKPSMELGPYLAWSLFYYGWTIDLLHLKNDDHSKEYDVSLYDLAFSADIFWRSSGTDYHVNDIHYADGTDASSLNGKAFSGVKSSVYGANIYYVFNHSRYSFPAAFGYSTQQKISCGSPMVNIGYTRHSFDIDWSELNHMAEEHLGKDSKNLFPDDVNKTNITYSDYSIYGGYGYNWVFAKNWVFGAALSLGTSYKRPSGERFNPSNISVNGIGRFGITWTNNHWFYGMDGILHSYNYHKDGFFTSNNFGMINIVGGVNFGVLKKYRKKKTQQ